MRFKNDPWFSKTISKNSLVGVRKLLVVQAQTQPGNFEEYRITLLETTQFGFGVSSDCPVALDCSEQT